MAVANPNPWKKLGSWAQESEGSEATLLPPVSPVAAADTADFPSLAAAATTKVPKKKKPQTISLGELHNGKYAAPKSRTIPESDLLLSLPKGPTERTAEELERLRLGGFRSGGESRWDRNSGPARDSEEPRRNGSGSSSNGARDFASSRADDDDNWVAGKRPVAGMPERRSGGFGDSQSQSRADDSDDWVSTKKPVFTSDRRERGGGFGDSHSRADDSASWVSNKSTLPPPPEPRRSTVWGFNKEAGPDSAPWERKREEAGGGEVGSGGRPRLVLQPRTLPIEERKPEVAVAVVEKEKKLEFAPRSAGANPFGAARPREEVLAAKGKDWREIDEKIATKLREEVPPERSFRRGSPEKGDERPWRKAEAPVAEAAETPAGSERAESEVAEESS